VIDNIEPQIVDLDPKRRSFALIRSQLGIGFPRLKRTIDEYVHTAKVPRPATRGRPLVITDPTTDFLNLRTIEMASFTAPALADETYECLDVGISARRINEMRAKFTFKCRPPRHLQPLTDSYVSDRMAFCQQCSQLPPSLPVKHCSDESRIVPGDDKQWVW
jgi:hypothetical protein